MANPKPRTPVPRAVTPRVATPRALTPRAVPPRFTRNRKPPRFGQKGPRKPERPTLSWLVAGLMLCVLMGLPGLAAIKLSQHVPGYGLLGYFVVVSVLAFIFCASDKRQAKDRQWRMPENFLHFFELIGGWPGSFVAQHRFRHKVKKGSYQLIFWLIVAGYQLVALDYLADWRISWGLKDPVVRIFTAWGAES